MGIEALLKTRAVTSADVFSGVPSVAGVQPSNDAAFDGTPPINSGVARCANQPGKVETATPATPCNLAGVPPEPLLHKARTLATPATPQYRNAEDKANLARLAARVWYAEGWQDADIRQAIQLALDDYDAALICFTDLAARMGIVISQDDDRRGCYECSELIGRRCRAAERGLIAGADRRGYEPILYMVRRCDQFKARVTSEEWLNVHGIGGE